MKCSGLHGGLTLAASAMLAWALCTVAAGQEAPAGDKDSLKYHTENSPEWLRLSRLACSMHPYPGELPTVIRYYTDPQRATKENPIWRPTFGGEFEYVMPYQGIPGVVYVPAGWATPKVGTENSVKNVNYAGMAGAIEMLHRKGEWVMMHVPAQMWWAATSTKESSPEGALYLNMTLLSLKSPPDGFNFDASLEAGTDIAAIRKKADEVLGRGHYAMHGESHYADPPGYSTHYMHLFGMRKHAWEDKLHGMHYLWFAVRGLNVSASTPDDWGRRLVKLMVWDCLFWGGGSAFLDLNPAFHYDRDRTRQFVSLTELQWIQGDVLDLVKDPVLLSKADMRQGSLGVNVFDGAAPTYFRTPNSPGVDKRLYTFKTGGAPIPFNNPAYYETMPPVPQQSPKGDLFAVKYEPGFHFVSAGIDGGWRTPVRRDGDKVIVSAPGGVARYGTFPAPGETIQVVRYRTILSLGRSGRQTMLVRVNKQYAENLQLEVDLRRADSDDRSVRVSRPVINQEVEIDLPRDLKIEDFRDGDELHVRLLREHVMDRWHIHYFLCDEAILSGREMQIAASFRGAPEGDVARGADAAFEVELTNRSRAAKTVETVWQLPTGWALRQGELRQKITVPAFGAVRTSIRARAGEQAALGGQKVCVTADSGDSADGVPMNLGMADRLVVVGPANLRGEGQVLASVETGGFKGVGGVTIPVSQEVNIPPAGKTFKVVEYDSGGKIVNDKIDTECTPITATRAVLSWMIEGNDQPFRNFCISVVDLTPAMGQPKNLLLFKRNLTLGTGQKLVSEVKHKYCFADIEMAFTPPTAGDTWIGFMNLPPEDWSYRRFDPKRPQSLMAWNLRERPDDHGVVAMFDNGSGMVETSEGKRLDVRGRGTVDCDQAWGDFGWSHGNDALDVVLPYQMHAYRMEWQRLSQRWYVEGTPAFERQIVLDEPLPLTLMNRTKDTMYIKSIRVTSPFSRR